MHAYLKIVDYFLQKMAAANCALSDKGKADDMNSLSGVLPSHSLKILDMRSFFALKLPLRKCRPEFREEVTDEEVKDRRNISTTSNMMASNSPHRPFQGNSADGKSSVTMCDEYNLRFS